jgi:hypothetical protein
MPEKPINEIVGKQAKPSAAPETGATSKPAEQPAATPRETASGATSPGEVKAPRVITEDDIAGLKSALDKERERANGFEKQSKTWGRDREQYQGQIGQLQTELQRLQATINKPDPKALEHSFYTQGPEFVGQQVSAAEQRFQSALFQERVALSVDLARDKYEDYDDVMAVFAEAAKRDPSLGNELSRARLPAIAAYKKGKEILAGKSAQGAAATELEQLKAKIAALEAGRDGGQTSAEAETAAAAEQRPSVPRSNAGLRSSGVGKTTSWAGQTPIESVVGRQRRAAR